MLKYKLSGKDTIEYNGSILYRVVSLKDFRDVREGDLGGYIARPANLSQYGTCWVYNSAKVLLGGFISEDATIRDNVTVSGGSIYGNAVIMGNSVVTGYPVISGGVIRDNVIISGGSVIMGSPSISGNATIRDTSTVLDDAKVFGNAILEGNCLVERSATVSGSAIVKDNAVITGNAYISKDSVIGNDFELVGNGWLGGRGEAKFSPIVFSFSKNFNVTFDGTTVQFGCTSYDFDLFYDTIITNKSTDFDNLLGTAELASVLKDLMRFFYKVKKDSTKLIDRCR